MRTIRPTARLLAVPALLAVALVPGTAPGTATAADEPATPSHVQVVEDPRGDVVRPGGDESTADLTRVRYRTPFRVGGELRITARWVRLVDGRRRGSPDQLLWTEFGDRFGYGSWTVYVGNDGRVELEDYSGDEEVRVIRPDRVEVDYDFGANGRMDLRMSTEWMRRVDRRRTSFTSWSGGPISRPRDPVATSRPLYVGTPR
ncbi:hypothetical protein [Nocardioides sp. CFH 31398]|uniref:hypothetical protein n=1 Tax=Nocardioides sp. CFH 31398 TaxID=2919579 RepID=UPI001F0687E3|nr:hypothetical protein [Nocardioides sp. CFH 31398]MCH1865387.1 hypothetical protein [Nocardioides sp. CFH 31398]